MTNRYSAAYNTGFEAATQGELRDANPYAVVTWDHDEWFRGFDGDEMSTEKRKIVLRISICPTGLELRDGLAAMLFLRCCKSVCDRVTHFPSAGLTECEMTSRPSNCSRTLITATRIYISDPVRGNDRGCNVCPPGHGNHRGEMR